MLGQHQTHRLRISLALCAFVAAVGGACSSNEPRTQVMLIVDAEEPVRARATRLEVTFESRSELNHSDGVPYTEIFPTTEGSSPYWPFSVALLPRGGDVRRTYHVTARLYEGDNAIAVLRAHSGFVLQRTLELQLLFSVDCLDQQSLECSDQQTCLYGDCLSAFVDAASLAELGGAGPGIAADGGIQTGSSQVRSGSQREADGGSAGTMGAGGMSSPDARGNAGVDSGTMPTVAGNCGDGQVNSGEQCDTAIAQGMDGACPEGCVTVDPCEPLQLEGTGCQTRCMGYRIQTAMSGDGCCPPGADANSDMDCSASCGNGIQEADETCDPIETCPILGSTCAGVNACQIPTITGDAASCNARCVMQQVALCSSGDGCCGSADCTHDNDSDCSASCGNGVVDEAAGELCEPGSADRPCPESCDDGNPCTEDITTGSASNCNLRCDHLPITQTINGDGCCPPERGNANNDSDCEPRCGNRVVERGEFCDGFCPTAVSQCDDLIPCTRAGLTAGPCGMRCTFELIVGAANGDSCCPFGANANNDNDCSPSCGNLVVERGELCDGNCPTSCPRDADNDPCTVNQVVNTGCQRRCESRRLTANTAGMDGCCPAGANPSTDSDCMPPPPTCGNGSVETGETCDPCPTSCMETDMDPCTRAVLRGAGCNARCEVERITTTIPGDGCCPAGASSSTDSDCSPTPPVCGNGMTETGEDCDGPDCPTCDDGEACTTDMRIDIPDACHPTCRHAAVPARLGGPDGCCPAGENSSTDSDCTAPPPVMCGNGLVEADELCDGNCPSSCPAPSNCVRHDLTGTDCNVRCVPVEVPSCCPAGGSWPSDPDCPGCGNGVVEPPEECEGESDTCRNCREVTQDVPPDPVPEPDP